MKPIGLISTGVLLLLFGTVVPTYAHLQQHEQEAKAPKQEQQPQAQPKQQPQRAQQQAKPQGQRNQQPQRAQQHPQINQPSQQGQRMQQQAEQRGVWQQHRANNWQADHRTWQQRGGYNGYRIPDDRYRGYFGQGHGFHIYGLPLVIVGGYPRFQYGGFWFSILDPWPEYWPDNWYENDDVYIDYSNGGYYLYDPRYPGVGIAVSVSLN